MSLSCLASLIVGREFYKGKHGVTGSGHSGIPDLGDHIDNTLDDFGDKSKIPENAITFSIFLLGAKTKSCLLILTDTYWLQTRRDLREQTKEQSLQQWLENGSVIHRSNRAFCCEVGIGDCIIDQTLCDSTESHPFACVNYPISHLITDILSKTWRKLSHKRESFYFGERGWKKNWYEANKTCYSLPVKSTLLQSIRDSEEYSAFKYFYDSALEARSFWMNLFQDGDSLKWLSSPEEGPTFVDWRKDTDFYMKRSAGILTGIGSFSWSLEDPSSEHEIICETQDLKESHDTAVYVRTSVQSTLYGDPTIDLYCEQSGWYKASSFKWFIDGAEIYGVYISTHLILNSRQGPEPQIISQFQGYYYCSVDLDNTSKPIFSSKLLIRYPGVHTFILHMRSEIPENSNCSDLVFLELPFIGEFNKYLQANYQIGSRLFLKKVNCSG
ncbi:hypothetical protein AVEN_3489-1 [Araneus ventricosus]|uniref:Ig-like domain-containing protein n=1 Tax=Araneus ventricosus TaxID=182803 RepID=A0A4Y2QJF1_ARAVE|nr:hypothetical protein AVEN_3489-1 [Araneus ventricosus]